MTTQQHPQYLQVADVQYYERNNMENMEYTKDLYRCGSCNSNFDLLEEMILHKLNYENCSLVLFVSQKLNGIQIPRFVHGIVSVEENSNIDQGISKESNGVQIASKSSTNKQTDNNDYPKDEDYEMVEENFDHNLSFLQALPGSKSKARSVCKKCGNSYRDATILKTHLLTVHSDEKRHICDFENCSFACKTKASLERHIRIHTGEKPFSCESCGKSFRESGTLARHIKSRIPCTRKADGNSSQHKLAGGPKKLALHSEPKTLQILITKDHDFPPKHLPDEEVRNDMQIVTNEDSLEALKKDASQSLIQLLESAAKEAENCTTYVVQKTNVPGVDAISNEDLPLSHKIRDEVEEQISISSLLCLVCKQKYKTANELSQHLQQHLEDFKFRCDKCFYVDKDSDGLDRHCRIFHNKQLLVNLQTRSESWPEVAATQLICLHDILDEKNDKTKTGGHFRCHVCLKKFGHKSYFKMHMNSHTGGAHFECDQCKRTFINKDSLQKHLVSHSQERLFSCKVCSKQFKRSNHLKDHLRTHSESKPFKCKICSRSFKWQCVLKVHETTHSKDCLYCCETCGRQLRNKSSLIRHSKRHKVGSNKTDTRSVNATSLPAPSFSRTMKSEATTTAVDIQNVTQNTYLLVLDDNSLVLEDGTCILENTMIQPEDML